MSLKWTGTTGLDGAAYSDSAARSGLLPMQTSDSSFREDPFRLTPDQQYPYQGFAFQDAYQQLLSAVREGRGPVLLTGAPGTGKTLLLLALKRELELIGATVCFPSLVHASRLELLTACLQDTQGAPLLPDPDMLMTALEDLLTERFKAKQRVVLLADDTQDLDAELLETLATLWSLVQDDRSLLPMVLGGLPNLEEKLRPYLARSAPVAVEVGLRPLEAWEIRPFVLHRLRAAGHQGNDPFAAAAYGLIEGRSKGVPRRINLLCGTALMLANLEGRSTVTGEDVAQALTDNWLDDEQGTGQNGAPAREAPAKRPRAAVVRADTWVERIQRAPANATIRHDEQQATALTDQPTPSQRDGQGKQEETPTDVNEAFGAELAWEDEQTRVAADRNEQAPLSLGPLLRADETDAPDRARKASSPSRKWRSLRRPLLATAGLAGGVLIGGLVATHYPELTEILTAQFRAGGMLSTLGTSSAKTAEQKLPESASNDESAGGHPEAAMATAYSNLALLYQTRGDLDQAERMYKKALEAHKTQGHRESMARDFNNLGFVYWSRGDLRQAEVVYRKSLELHEALGEQAGMADNYANLGSVYWTRRDLPKAEAMYRQALTLNEALDRKEKLANNYGNLGVVYQSRGELQAAQVMHQKAIAIYERAGRQTEGLANAYGNLGSVYRRAGKPEAAEDMYVRALRLYQRVGNDGQANRAKALIEALRQPPDPAKEEQ